jgi:predicted nuclease of predicted toxin-antitoxin system
VLRFHLDENVDVAIAKGLRLRGIDVTTPGDVGLLSADDGNHLSFAATEERVLVTHDDDFLILASLGASHSGIAYCHPKSRSTGELVRYLDIVAQCLTAEEMIGRVEFL